MISSKYRFSLDVHDAQSRACLDVKRGDTNSRTLYITLTEGGRPYHISEECYAVFTATKPDGNIVFNPCVIDDGTIIYKLTPQTTAAVGILGCEIKLYGADDALITSPGFLIAVHETEYEDGDEVESEAEVTALTHLISQAATAIYDSRETTAEGKVLIDDLNDSKAELEKTLAEAKSYSETATAAASEALARSTVAEGHADRAEQAYEESDRMAGRASAAADRAEVAATNAEHTYAETERMATQAEQAAVRAEAAADRAEDGANAGQNVTVIGTGTTDINTKKWFGKKIVVDGSSITRGGAGNTQPTWHSFLKDMFALDTVYNHSESGSGWFIGGGTTIARVPSYEADADAVILMGDYNGIYNYTRGLGTIDDEPSLDGMCYARLKYLAETLISKYPLCPIIWVIEPPRASVGETDGNMVPMNPGSIYNKYSAVIEEVAEYYGFTHCNLMKNTIFRPWVQANFEATTSDGTHPWNNIQRTMAQVIAETMKRTPLIYNESYVVTPDYSGDGDNGGGDSGSGDSGGGGGEAPAVTLTQIKASANAGYTLFESDTLDTVKDCIRVVATYSDLSEKSVTDYTVTGELVAGTQTFTIAYGGMTTTVPLIVTAGYRTVTITGTDYIDEELLGKYLDGNGNPTFSRDGMFTSQYIPIKGNTTITFSGVKLHGLTNHDIAFYDASYGFISSFNVTSVAANKTTTVPENAAYFRFCDDVSSTNTITYVPG